MYSVIIPAAGRGSRMGLSYNKLLYSLNDNETIIQRTVNKFLNFDQFCEIIITIHPDDLTTFKAMFNHPKIKLVSGGKERWESVKCGVKACSNDIIFIHDGARCNVSDELIKNCLEAVTTNHDGGYVCGVKVIDSIREVNNGCVTKAVDRSHLYNMQTPQIFNKEDLLKAYSMGYTDTDEVGLMLQIGKTPKIIEGDYRNLKVTTKSDLELL